jgi:hypothetical protein
LIENENLVQFWHQCYTGRSTSHTCLKMEHSNDSSLYPYDLSLECYISLKAFYNKKHSILINCPLENFQHKNQKPQDQEMQYQCSSTTSIFHPLCQISNQSNPTIQTNCIRIANMQIVQYSRRHTMINHCDRRITLLSDTDIYIFCSI